MPLAIEPPAVRRRRIGRALKVSVALAVAAAGGLYADEPVVATRIVARNLEKPVCITADGSGRLFVCEQPGRVRIIEGGDLLPEPFLDISHRLSCCTEHGLLSIAFPPDYAESGAFYVDYTDLNGDTVVERLHRSGDPNVAVPNGGDVILHIAQPFSNHNGGQLQFGPDGYLYVGTGDGGSAGDPFDYGQNPSALLGKILRLDVRSAALPYAIPEGNPFTSRFGYSPEIWALGLRNPWRFSFDRKTGDLWIGDVGQNKWEEIDRQPARSGGGENYGWRVMEGRHCYIPQSCDQTGLVLPVAEYSHAYGCSVTGGYVYRGARFPRLLGRYFYGDYCSGTVWSLQRDGATWSSSVAVQTPFAVTAFGEDDGGELYVADYIGGKIAQIVDTAPGCALGCEAEVVDSVPPGVAAPFAAHITAAECSDPIVSSWDFGDGSPPVEGAGTSHAFDSPGTFAWRLTTTSGASTCTASGAVTVRPRFRRALRSD